MRMSSVCKKHQWVWLNWWQYTRSNRQMCKERRQQHDLQDYPHNPAQETIWLFSSWARCSCPIWALTNPTNLCDDLRTGSIWGKFGSVDWGDPREWCQLFFSSAMARLARNGLKAGVYYSRAYFQAHYYPSPAHGPIYWPSYMLVSHWRRQCWRPSLMTSNKRQRITQSCLSRPVGHFSTESEWLHFLQYHIFVVSSTLAKLAVHSETTQLQEKRDQSFNVLQHCRLDTCIPSVVTHTTYSECSDTHRVLAVQCWKRVP